MANLLHALACRNRGRPPVWLMRQAGRYSPSYQKIRAEHSLYSLFHNSELIEEITMQPIVELGVDAAIIFSDILIVLDAFKHPYSFQEGPLVEKVQDRLVLQDTSFPFLAKAISHLKQRLSVPLIGFAGGVYTLSTYLGRFDMMEELTEAVIALLKLQVASGVEAVQIFDSWAGQVKEEDYERFVLQPLARIVRALDVPLIYFAKHLGARVDKIISLGVSALSLDKALPDMRKHVGPHVALQGSLDPDLLFTDEGKIEKAVKELMVSMRGDPGFIVNLGHGIKPGSSFELVKHLVRIAQTEGERLWH